MTKISQSVRIEGLGQGPTIRELREFIERFGDDYDAPLTLTKTNGDRPMDQDSWSISGSYTS